MVPYKNRKIDLNNKVEVYRCLTRKGHQYSIRQFGKVVAHSEQIKLKDVTYHINESGKNRAIESRIRNVHATVKGLICNEIGSLIKGKVTYYPFNKNGFICNGKEIKESNYITIDKNELTAYGR